MTRHTSGHTSSTVCNFVSPQWLWPSAGLAWLSLTLSLKPQGTRLKVRLYCREMDGSGTCCGLSLAPRQSYQLRLNLGSRLLRITFAATPVCLCAPAAAKHPLLWTAKVQRSIFSMDPSEAKWETCMGLSSPIQWVVCKPETRHASLECYSSPFFATTLQETD